MFTRIRKMHPVTGIVIGVVATLVLSGTAVAVTDTTFTYSTVQTGYLSIHPADMSPSDNLAADSYYIDHSGAAVTGNGCYNAGVNLPQLSKVITMQTYYRNLTDASRAWLLRNNLSTDTSDFLVDQNIPNSNGVRTSVTSTVASTQRTVRNNVYSYGFGFCVGPSNNFEGARITYTYTTAGD